MIFSLEAIKQASTNYAFYYKNVVKAEKTGPNTNLVIRSRDAGHLAAARAEVEAMLKRVRAAVKVNV